MPKSGNSNEPRDLLGKSVRITPEKGSDPRIMPLSNKLVDALNSISKNTTTVFGIKAELTRRSYSKQRNQLAAKLQHSRLKQ
ncbi:MAG: hypothetical protein NWE98_12155 [Candidatus Bathyarchaeota archaeon]|nr:hypothetical protein [Candidatus Bathyarchaeota archaeon]